MDDVQIVNVHLNGDLFSSLSFDWYRTVAKNNGVPLTMHFERNRTGFDSRVVNEAPYAGCLTIGVRDNGDTTTCPEPMMIAATPRDPSLNLEGRTLKVRIIRVGQKAAATQQAARGSSNFGDRWVYSSDSLVTTGHRSNCYRHPALAALQANRRSPLAEGRV